MSADQITSPRDGTRELPEQPTVLFYRRDGLVVTNRFFAVDGRRYGISHLTDLMQGKGSVHPGVVAGIVTAAVEAVVLIPLASVLQQPLVWLLTVTALMVPSLVAIICAVRWPPRWELFGRYRGRMISLYATRDHFEFGKACRALQRAIESDRSG
jgi:hypothetical protein